MTDQPDDPGPILVGEEDALEEEPECQIKGCDRPGAVGKKLAGRGEGEQAVERFVCEYHHRLLFRLRVAIASVAVLALLVAIYLAL